LISNEDVVLAKKILSLRNNISTLSDGGEAEKNVRAYETPVQPCIIILATVRSSKFQSVPALKNKLTDYEIMLSEFQLGQKALHDSVLGEMREI